MGAEQITVAVGYVRVATGSQRQRESGVDVTNDLPRQITLGLAER